MKCSVNKFIIFIFIVVLLNFFSIFLRYDFKVFTNPKPPLNMFDNIIWEVKYKYSYPEIETIGFYTDVTGDRRIHILYELQDSIMPVFIEDSIDHNKVLCFSESNACEVLAKNENMDLKGKYDKMLLYTRKDKK